MRKIIYLILVLTIIISGCSKEEVKKQMQEEAIPVKAMKLELGELKDILDYTGSIKAKDEVIVYPKVTGKIIEKIKQEGDSVNKQDVIAYIDRDEVGLKFEKAPVESPISGFIGRIYVDIGSNVSTQTPVALVVDMDSVTIDLDIPERYLSKIFIGQEAEISVDAYPEKIFVGKITKISPVLNSLTRATPLEITIDNPEGLLKSGMFAKTKLVLGTYKDIPVILKEAVIGREPDTSVYVIENNKAVLRSVELGFRQGSSIEVKEGLKEGDLVVIMGQQRLYQNAPVVVEMDNKEQGK